MSLNLELIDVEPSEHLPKGVLNQLVFNRSSFGADMNDSQKGQHGVVISAASNAGLQQLEKVKLFGVAVKLHTIVPMEATNTKQQNMEFDDTLKPKDAGFLTRIISRLISAVARTTLVFKQNDSKSANISYIPGSMDALRIQDTVDNPQDIPTNITVTTGDIKLKQLANEYQFQQNFIAANNGVSHPNFIEPFAWY